ncbi:SURF1 family protein [Allofranklinella schreckenbergeri]|uniref:SURF1-like protein n=1 Tax=Allofranklinella schreckenbergeri TaxID=1076744 RepID=A0A3M6QCZ7_9BURK|nr:SURF1 family cytochrome oxidase biogenesis protein [Allofranklinella schreckenbergeri]RMX00984.1 SURF1 family protein [Allofranklinella schreckenbergeri]
MSDTPRRKSPLARWAMLAFFLFNIVLFSSLGIWQVQRLAWKKELVARIASRTQAAPVPAPLTPTEWAALTADNAEYRHITLEGQLLRDQEVAVYTNTALGAGYWAMAPLLVGAAQPSDGQQQPAQAIVWINRGFVPSALRQYAQRPEAPSAQVRITGLLRLPDKPHLFLRENVPQEERWYRRVPAEFSAARPLPAAGVSSLPTAPYFVHAHTATTEAANAEWPRAGLPLATLRNNHLSYALTWFTLALMNVAALVFLLLAGRRQPQSAQARQQQA